MRIPELTEVHGTTSPAMVVGPRFRSLGPALLLAVGGCAIAPDFASDAGADAGSIDGGPDAGGTVDAGSDAGAVGSMGATFTTSATAGSKSLAWNGSDLAQTSVDASGAAGPQQVTLRGNNLSSGSFTLVLTNLTPGATSDQVLSIAYQPPSGPDSWLCNSTSPVACLPQVTLTSYDGSTIAGTFSVSFPVDSFGVSSELTSGNFDVLLPQ